MAIVAAEKIVMRRTADLIPYANNSRTHSDKQVVQIASIREFGFTNPLLIDELLKLEPDGAPMISIGSSARPASNAPPGDTPPVKRRPHKKSGPIGGVRQFTGYRSRKWRPIFGLWYLRQVCDEPAAGRQGSKSATMGGRAGKRRRIRRSGASRRPAAALYARWPAGSPRHRPPAMKRIFARSRRQGRPLPAALCTERGATFGRLR
jgi:hypothetical protein